MATSRSYHQVSLIVNKRIWPWVENLEYKRILLAGIMERLEAQKQVPPALIKVESSLQWPTQHFCGLTQFNVSQSGQVVFGGSSAGGGDSGALCSTQLFRDPGSFHLVTPLYSESLGSSPSNR